MTQHTGGYEKEKAITLCIVSSMFIFSSNAIGLHLL